VAHADPSSEIPLSLAVLDGEVVLRSQRGTRTLPADEFQRDMLTTARAPDELVTAVRFPVMSGRGIAFREVARRHGDFAIIAVAAVAENAQTIRLGVGGMSGRPAVRKIADGGSAIRDSVDRLASELEGYEDLHASAAMRRDLLRRLGPVVIEEAVGCAR
jgi:2-furoyl-CoA dehydrogenase FAD binding subunit